MRPFNPGKELSPCCQLLVHERAKELFNDAVQYLSLVVALGVICRAHPQASTTQAK